MKKNTYTLFSLLFVCSILRAEKSVNDTLNLNEVVVTGTKTEVSRKLVPISVSQISAKEIESTGQTNILPALNTFVPGIFVTERNILGFGVAGTSAGSISMRGISSSPNTNVLVLIDGHPQYQGIFGHPLADAYVSSDVEKVEIIRGPASLLYGSNAMAGVINIITKKQKTDGVSGSAGASYGSYNTRKYYATLGQKKRNLNTFFSINHDQTDGVRDSTGFNITNGYAKLGYKLSNHLNIMADYNIAKFTADDKGPVNSPAFLNIDILRSKTSVSIDSKFNMFEGGLKFYHNFGTHSLSDGFHSSDHNTGIMLFQSAKLKTGTTITAGFDLKEYGGKSNQGYKHDTLINIKEMAGYLYAQQEVFHSLSLSAGIRLENNSKFGNEIVPLAGMTYNLSTSTTFKGSVSKGFRSPTIMELYLFVPNTDLQPERMTNYELSWLQSFFNNDLNLELTAYRVVGKNLIQVIVPPFPPHRKNTGSFNNKGFEITAKYTVLKHLFLHANYSYLHIDVPVIAAPRQQLNGMANFTHGIWQANVSAQYIEKLYTQTGKNPVVQPDYLLVNARFSVRPTNGLEIFSDFKNILNQHYQINYGYPMPGFNLSAGFNIKF